MKIGGVDRNTPNPEGGVIEKDASGDPNGIFEEKAIGLISLHIPPPTVAEMRERFVRAMQVANAYGLTSVTNPGLDPKQLRALQRLMLAHKLTLRYSAMYNPPQIVSAEKWDEETNANGASSGFGNEWLKFDAIGEMTSDGGMTFRTAFTRDPYPDDSNYHGIPSRTKERLMSNVLIGNRNDWRFSIHSVGDAAIDWVLDGYEAVIRLGGDRELKRDAAGHVIISTRPQLAAVRFDDRTTDAQPEPQPTWLGRIKGLKEPVDCSRCQSRTRIHHGNAYTATLGLSAVDLQPTRSLTSATHCLESIYHQVEEHLLEFDPISLNEWQAVGEFDLHRHSIFQRFAAGELDHLADCSIDLQGLPPRRRPLDEGANTVDDLGGSIAVLNNSSERLPHLFQIRRPSVQPAQSCGGVCDGCGDWLFTS
jgi:hypothetical protein